MCLDITQLKKIIAKKQLEILPDIMQHAVISNDSCTELSLGIRSGVCKSIWNKWNCTSSKISIQEDNDLRLVWLWRCDLLGNGGEEQDCQQGKAHRRGQVTIFHDNTRQYTANIAKEALNDVEWEVQSHPPYSPNLAPTDYHIFLAMSNQMRRVTFATMKTSKTVSTTSLRPGPVTFVETVSINWSRSGSRL